MLNLLERNGVVVIPIDEACREVDAFSLWEVSAAAIIKRNYDLGLFSEATYRRAFVQLNQMGRTQEPYEPPPRPRHGAEGARLRRSPE